MYSASFIDLMILFKRSRDIYCRELLETHDLRPSDMDVLLYLSTHAGEHTAREICEAYRVPKSLVSASVDLLAGRGLICRRTDPQDRRRVLLTFTPPAEAIISDIDARTNEFARRICEGVPEADIAAIERAFGRMRDNMIAMNGSE